MKRKQVTLIILAILALMLVVLRLVQTQRKEATAEVHPTQAPIMLLSVDVYGLVDSDFGPHVNPEDAKLYPDAECATWNNGGLEWLELKPVSSDTKEWFLSVHLPEYRFCGFPKPYVAPDGTVLE